VLLHSGRATGSHGADAASSRVLPGGSRAGQAQIVELCSELVTASSPTTVGRIADVVNSRGAPA